MLRQAATRSPLLAAWATCPSALAARLSSSAGASASDGGSNTVRLAIPPTTPTVVPDAGSALRDARAAHRASMTVLRKQWTAEAAATAAAATAARAAKVARASTRHKGEVAAKAAKKAKAASKVQDSAAAGSTASAAAAAQGKTWRAAVAAIRAEDAAVRHARLLAASQHWIGTDPKVIAARVEEALANPSPLFQGDVPPRAAPPSARKAAAAAVAAALGIVPEGV